MVFAGHSGPSRPFRQPARRRTACAALLLAVTTGLGVAPAAHAAVTARAARTASAVRHHAALPLSAARAAAKARATGKPVVATALTTPTSRTVAHPNGTMTVSESLLPSRVLRDGAWVSLDPTLHRVGNVVMPQATVDTVDLSNGGDGPLAILFATGHEYSMTWPNTLPTPILSGSTATYLNVLPGVNLELTVDGQGGVSSVFVVTSASAASNPALQSIGLSTSTSPGLSLTVNSDDSLSVTAGPQSDPVITADPPLMWDSSPVPPGTTTITDPATGVTLAEPGGDPASSSIDGPGAGALVTTVPVSMSGNTLFLNPPASALTGPSVTYPLYIDPVWRPGPIASKWAIVRDSASTQWMNQNLKAGYCDYAGCAPAYNARSLFQMPIPTNMPAGSQILTSDLDLYNYWTASNGCSPEPLQLWTASGQLKKSVTWSNASWGSLQEQETFGGFTGGSSVHGCGASNGDVVFGNCTADCTGSLTGGSRGSLTNVIQSDLGSKNYQAFGLRVPDLGNDMEWRRFYAKDPQQAGRVDITLTLTYDAPPVIPPHGMGTNPGGGCHSGADESKIGDDDVTLLADPSDPVGNPIDTVFDVFNRQGVQVGSYDAHAGSQFTVPANTIQTVWNANGATGAFRYFFYAVSTDTRNTSFSAQSETCWFLYNPTEPGMPIVTFPNGTTGIFGGTIQATFAPSTSNCASSCPATYTYQFGASAPVTVNASGSGHTWTGNVKVTQFGPAQLTVSATDSVGNPGPAATPQVVGTAPTPPYADGYFSGGANPDVLVTSSSHPGLWLVPGNNNASTVDVGSLGNGIISPGAAADWAGAEILHGNFLGHGLQDVMAYWPKNTTIGADTILAGSAQVVAGTGQAATVNPANGNPTVQAGNVSDPTFCDPTAEPSDLVAAGDASQTALAAGASSNLTDLIGIISSTAAACGTTGESELVLYTTGVPAGYGLDDVQLSTAGPDGNTWGDFTLATAQLPDTTVSDGDPANTALFALDRTNGQLWESVNTGCPANCAAGPLVGTPNSASVTDWTQVKGGIPWGTTPPSLVSADVGNATGPGTSANPEIWTTSGGNLTGYLVVGKGGSCTNTLCLQSEGTNPIAYPSDSWPLADGTPFLTGSGSGTMPTTATDSVTGQTSPLTAFTWSADPALGSALSFNNGPGYMLAPASVFPQGERTPSISLWFKTTSVETPLNTDAVLASLQVAPVTSGNTTTSNYDPVLYIGTDGRLYGQWLGAGTLVLGSDNIVNDGVWHHAVLTVSAGFDALYLDGHFQEENQDSNVLLPFGSGSSHFTLGAGYIGYPYPAQTHTTSGVAYLTGYIGEISGVQITQ
jgi:hypothetical protein